MRISSETIERKAQEVREKLGLMGILAPDIYCVLEELQERIAKFSFRPALASEMGLDEAWMDDASQTLTAREYVLEDAKAGRERARFTLAHELGHYFLGHKGRRRRNPNREVYAGSRERIQESEANEFASCFLVPTSMALDCNGPEEISQRFQVSMNVAEIAFERAQTSKRKASGEKRRPPDSVIDFLKEAKRKGYHIRSNISDYE